jgi:UDP-GlcNAc3NAcA epimerase
MHALTRSGSLPTILTLVGARPQFIKAAPVSRALREAGLTEVLVHSGQHYDAAMSERLFDELGIPAPAHHLGIGSGTHADQTGRIMIATERLIASERPDWVLVYGDTNTTLAGAIAAAKLCVPVAHVEAGLRSGNMRMPEEINRIATDRISSLLFAPTPSAAKQLAREGIPAAQVVLSGDVMYDAALTFAARAREVSGMPGQLGLKRGGYLLATVHRAENTDDLARLGAILQGLGTAGLPVCLPLHPRTAKRLADAGMRLPSGVHAVEPVGYLDMLRLLGDARLVVTDSGGVQKEAYFARTPCVTVRTETEWPELVEAGWNRLAPPDSAAAVAGVIADALKAPLPDSAPEFYGRGDAAGVIAAALAR